LCGLAPCLKPQHRKPFYFWFSDPDATRLPATERQHNDPLLREVTFVVLIPVFALGIYN
jgi:hypothetical protein